MANDIFLHVSADREWHPVDGPVLAKLMGLKELRICRKWGLNAQSDLFKGGIMAALGSLRG